MKGFADCIDTHSLSCVIDERAILNDVSILVKKGEMVGIVGPNGSGKTTMLKHIYRVLPVKKNTVYINGKALESMAYSESAREMTVVRQENSSEFTYTVENMVLMGRAPYRRDFESFTKEDKAIASRALSAIGMSLYADRPFGRLSGGEKQRVLIARSLAQQADIFLLDEPTNHLDVYYQWSLMEMIKELRVTVLGVFHELNLAARFCDRIYMLKDGGIVCSGAPEEVFTPARLAEVFRVKASVAVESGHPHIIFHGAATA